MHYQFVVVGDAVENLRDDQADVPTDAITAAGDYHARSARVLPFDPTQADYVGGTGNDIYTGTGDNDTISGNGGNDTLAGAGGADTIDGGDGNDTLISYLPQAPQDIGLLGPRSLDIYADRDTLTGGAGDDMLIAGYGDNVDGGAGANSLFLNLRGATSGVTVDFRNLTTQTAPNFPQPMTVGGGTIANVAVVVIDGSDFADTIRGGDSSGAGPYSFGSIYGNGGDDRLTGGAYTMLMDGGSGDDWIDGRTSSYISTIYGGEGNDTVYGNPNSGFAKVYGGNGNDAIYGFGEAYGEAGDDVMDNSSYGSSSIVSGGAGADIITGSGYSDLLSSGGALVAVNGPPFDLSFLLPLDSGTEHDRIDGGGGNDVIAIGYGDDADGGSSGTDALCLSLLGASSGVTVDTTAIIGGGSVSIGGGTIVNFDQIEAIFGTNFADSLTIAAQNANFVVHGEDGDDTIRTLGGNNQLYGDAGNDTIIGSDFVDKIYGGAGADTIQAGGGNDTIIVAAAADFAPGETVDGGTGNDTLSLTFDGTVDISNATTSIERLDHGTVSASLDVRMAAAQMAPLTYIAVNSLTFTTAGAVSLAGVTWAGVNIQTLSGGNTFTLSDAGNSLDLTGMLGTFVGAVVNGGAGNDTITTLPGGYSDTIYGGGGDDTIYAGDGFDTLYGGLGLDIFHGGGGDDVVNVTGNDYVSGEVYDGGADNDTLSFFSVGSIDISASTITAFETLIYNSAPTTSTLSLTLAQLAGFRVVNAATSLTLTTGGSIAFTGKTLAGMFNLAPVDTVFDLTGVTLSAGSVTVRGNSGNDTLIGSASLDFLFGGDGNDRLDGRAGGDQMTGGLGDDTYILDSSGDRVFESVNGGNDTVESSATVTSANSANVETIKLTGTATINATGDGNANVIVGNSGNNILSGGAGNDTLVGYGGADTLRGGADNDALIVSTGGDGTVVDGGADFDTLIVSGTVTLGGLIGIEAIDLQSGGALSLSEALFNAGLAPNATLSGTGSLTINMGAGDSELYLQQLVGGSNVTIIVNGSANNDLVKGAINAVNVINGGEGSDSIRGGSQIDTLNGGNGNDKLEGAGGADILTGGSGVDTFRFQSANASTVAAPDRITDFVSGTDKLGFLLLDSDPNTPGIQGFSYIDTQAFHHNGAAEIRYETSGADLTVQVDIDGDGVADMAIVLQGLGGGSLGSGDFLI